MEKINLDKILKEYIQKDLQNGRHGTTKTLKEAMKEACRQTLELAAKNAKAYVATNGEWTSSNVAATVNKQSILDIINQIE